MVTGNASVETAVEALRLGAMDYLIKPVDTQRLRAVLANLARTRELNTRDLVPAPRIAGRRAVRTGGRSVRGDALRLRASVARRPD